MRKKQLARIGDRQFPLTNLDKEMWPKEQLTKADLIDYYLKVAASMSKYLQGRYLVFTRYPDGIEGKWFYQKDCPAHAPEWIRVHPHWSQGSQRTLRFITGADAATLAWLGNQACIEIHGWLSLHPHLQQPQWAVFDLDPAAPAAFKEAAEVARLLRDLLSDVGLRSYVKTSGGSGLHIFVPVKPVYSFAQTQSFVRAVGQLLRKQRPDLITLERQVTSRSGKVYIDYLQNGMGKTMAMPYTPRPLPTAPVSMPLDWSELGDQAPDFRVTNIDQRLTLGDEAFARCLHDEQSLGAWLS